MATDALEGLLDRDLAIANVRDRIDIAVPLIREVVNYGTMAFARCDREPKTGDYHVPMFSLFLHQLEMTDAVELIVAGAAPAAARPQLRSILEAGLSIEYITGDYEMRSRYYLVATTRGRIAKLEGFANVAKAAGLTVDPKKEIANLEAFLQKPDWAPIDALYKATKRRPPWYSLGGGPRNLRDLAIALNRENEYEILYREWSGVMHADDLARQIKGGPGGKTIIRRLRDPQQLATCIQLAVGLGLRSTRCFLKQYRPEEIANGAFTRWFLEEVRERWHAFFGSPPPEPV